MRPEINTSQAFWFYGGRGPLLVGRGLLALGAGVLIGAVTGKQLPALLLAALTVGGMTLASEVAFGSWHETEAVEASDNDHLSRKAIALPAVTKGGIAANTAFSPSQEGWCPLHAMSTSAVIGIYRLVVDERQGDVEVEPP
jgi:hypothetical protein